jgi:DnaJ-class molecular chaperone
MMRPVTCPHCDGRGKWDEPDLAQGPVSYMCERCLGSGLVADRGPDREPSANDDGIGDRHHVADVGIPRAMDGLDLGALTARWSRSSGDDNRQQTKSGRA